MPRPPRQPVPRPRPGFATADRLHSAAIRLLRTLRVEDRASGLSALSVLGFGGPRTMSTLAQAEPVQPPTITRLIAEMEKDGLVERVRSDADRRVLTDRATAEGRRLLEEGRRRRVVRLAAALEALPAADRKLLARAAELIEQVARYG